MNPGNVPTAVVAPVLAALIEDRWPSRLRPDAEEYGITILAEKAGCHVDSIDTILRQKHPGAEFDLVDRLLCALGRPDMWSGVLADVYPMKFIEKCASPACRKRFPEKQVTEKRRKKFCSKKCQRLDEAIRRGLASGFRAQNRCNRGHRFTPETTVIRKSGTRQCRICINDRRRERMSNPEYRARIQAYNTAYKREKAARVV